LIATLNEEIETLSMVVLKLKMQLSLHEEGGKRLVILVAGAGVPEVNGIYHYHSIFQSACMFKNKCKYQNKVNTEFSMYRCKMDDGSSRWFISIVPENREPGSDDDVDFYTASPYHYKIGQDDDFMPPQSKWIPVRSEETIFHYPSPTVTCSYELVDESDSLSDREVIDLVDESDNDREVSPAVV
jgi:hypothetical protein